MSNILDDTISRLQEIANALTEDIKQAPAYPVEKPDVLPLAIASVTDGNGRADDASGVHLFINVGVDFYFSRTNLAAAFKQINAVIPEYLKRLGGDPNLNGTAATIVFPVNFEVGQALYGSTQVQMLSFGIMVKYREDPTPTA